jgi:hypothetical protein|tara:strand:- start:70502 stop:71302 length:801 start_codon:yes stop_codon:yes gene_type:complete
MTAKCYSLFAFLGKSLTRNNKNSNTDSFKRELIKAANEAHSSSLDEVIVDGYFMMYVSKKINESYMDVQLASIKGLSKDNFYPHGSNWRQSVYGLDCDGWGELRKEIIDYFKSDEQGREFPTKGSDKEMRVYFVGDVAYCGIGNHRLVAAKAWLTYEDGDDALLRNINCSNNEVLPEFKEIFEQSLNEGAMLYYGYTPEFGVHDRRNIRNILRVDSKDSTSQFYEITGHYPDEIKSIGNRLLCRFVKYKHVGEDTIKQMLHQGNLA